MLHVGVDLASATMGLAVLNESGDLEHVSRHATSSMSKTHTKWDRYMVLLSSFVELMSEVGQHNVESVYIEGYGGNAHINSLIPAVECGTIFKVILERLEMMPLLTIVPPTSLKKFTAGTGNAKKDQMIAKVFQKYGFMAPDSDQADAYALAMMSVKVFAHNRLQGELFEYEKEVVGKLGLIDLAA